MKNKIFRILCCIVALCVVGAASAQGKAAPKKAANNKKQQAENTSDITYGARVGMNFSTFGNDSEAMRGGVIIGLYAEKPLIDGVSLQAELVYSQQGAMIHDQLNSIGISVNRQSLWLNYINLPVMLQYNIKKGLNVKLGVQPGYLIAATERSKTATEYKVKSVSEGYNAFDVAIPIGASYIFNSGISIDLRYAYGLMDITDNIVGQALKPDYRNRVFTMMLGYKF